MAGISARGQHACPLMEPALLARYLRLLGVSGESPDIATLRELVRAQSCRVPFENVSKLYYKKRMGLMGVPRLGLYLDGIERYRFGGTCYSNNYHFHQLLANLGFRAKLCAADMGTQDSHMVILVDLEGREYLVDVGYAAPFVAPLPRDLKTDHVVAFGADRYVLKPQDAAGRSRVEFYRGGVLKHGYLAKPEPKQLHHFEAAIGASYRAEATFMNALLLARFCPHDAVIIHNLSVSEMAGGEVHIRTLRDRPALVEAIWERFGIPREIARDVVGELGPFGDAWL